MKHIHHIIPKHMGGTDNPDNLIKLTIEEHARAHYLLWNQHGKQEDKVAWKALSGMIGKEEILLEKRRLGGINSTTNMSESRKSKLSDSQRQNWKDPSYRERQTKVLLENQSNATRLALSEESIQKRKETYKRIGFQQGSNNAMFGRKWITNGEETYLLDKNQPIPEGFVRGKKLKGD